MSRCGNPLCNGGYVFDFLLKKEVPCPDCELIEAEEKRQQNSTEKCDKCGASSNAFCGDILCPFKAPLLMALFMLLSTVSFGQMTFHQAYMIDKDTILVMNEVSFTLTGDNQTLMLPNGPLKVTNSEMRGKTLILKFNNQWIGEYYFSPTLGNVLSIVWKGGRLVMWENYITTFQITPTKRE